MPNNTQPGQNPADQDQGQDQDQDQVQADNLLSQPDPDVGAVAEEVSLDQQSDSVRRVGQLPKDAEAAVGDSLKTDKPA